MNKITVIKEKLTEGKSMVRGKSIDKYNVAFKYKQVNWVETK